MLRFPAVRVLLLSLTCLVPWVQAADLQPYSAVYAFNLDNKLSGQATRSLMRHGAGYRYQFSASTVVASANEISDFTWNGRQVQSTHYENVKQVFFRSRKASVDYDWSARRAHAQRDKDKLDYALLSDALDPLNMEIQIREDLLKYGKLRDDYMLADPKGLFPLKFEINGTEVINTPYGKLDTLKVRRVHEGTKRETQFWLAKTLDYLPVKFVQRDDTAVYTLTLSGYDGPLRSLPVSSAPSPAVVLPKGSPASAP